MLRRRFGKTEIQMPVLSCGGMRYQHSWKDEELAKVPPENQENLEATIRHAVKSGINHIETARGYGSSERQLGLILPQYPREEIIVQTKIAPENDPVVFRDNFMESLERLRLDHVDLLGLHGINDRQTLEWAVRPHGCLAMARELQEQGLARNIGFSTHAPLDVLLEAVRHEGDGGFDYVNLHWYYIFQTNWPAIEEATNHDMGVFIISPSDKGGMLYDPPEKLVQLTEPYHPIVFNDLFCLDRPEVHTLSVGASKPEDFDRHLQAVRLFDERHKHLPEIEERLRKAMEEAVGADFADSFAKGLPSWEDTPGEMNIPVMLWLHNLVKAYDMVEYGKMRYNLLGNAGHWFPGNNASRIDHVDLSPALQHTPFATEIPRLLRETHEMLFTAPKKRLSESED